MSLAREIPRDAQLPQLARAIDAEGMRPVFDAALRRYGEQRVTACRVDRVKYRPGRNCTVSYRLEIRDEQRDCRYEQRVAGRFCGPGQAASRHAGNRHRVALGSPCGVPALLVPGMEFFAWFLPNDPKLAALPALCEVVHGGGAALAEALELMFGEATGVARMEAGLVQYVPESRACARFEVALDDGRHGRLYAKLDREDSGAATQRLMEALYASPARREGRLRTPRPLLWQPATGLHWQQAVPGEALLRSHVLCPPSVAGEVGRLVAALHDTPLALARRVGGGEMLGRMREMHAMLERVDPAWGLALAPLLRRLEPGLAAIRALPQATLHGDLHPNNILIDEDRLSLIDLDGARSGPAVLELGAWIADGLYRAHMAQLGLVAVQESVAALIAAYRSESGQPVSGSMLAWATSLALVERAYRNVANLKPGRLAQVPALLALATLIAEGGDLERSFPDFRGEP